MATENNSYPGSFYFPEITPDLMDCRTSMFLFKSRHGRRIAAGYSRVLAAVLKFYAAPLKLRNFIVRDSTRISHLWR
jgi:hypothetical protein